jgi:hypothetical protein
MNDMTFTDMTPFIERQDRRLPPVFIAMLLASLVVSGVAFTQGVLNTELRDSARAGLWFPILTYPLLIVSFWGGLVLWKHKRPKPPGGRYLMNEDDARNVTRVARAGFVFTVGFGVLMVVSQLGVVLKLLDALPSLFAGGDWIVRAAVAIAGFLTMYFGNAWPRMPTFSTPGYKGVTQRKYNRLGGWLNVLIGLVFALLGLLLPIRALVPAVLVVSVLAFIATMVFVVRYCVAMKSPTAR